MVLLFTLKTCLKMITGRLRPVIKLVLEFGFDFGNENQITCTRSNQHAFGNVLHGFVLESPMKNILEFMKIFTKCFVRFLGSKWFKTLVTCGVAFPFENMFENDYRSVKARNKTCAWVWF